MNRERFGWRVAYLVAAFGIYLTDQASKAWAVGMLRYGEDRAIVPGLLSFVYAENRGIAFGQLQQGGAFGRWFFVGLASLAALGVLVYFWRTTRADDRILGACALLLAGILGNLTDRVRFGYVIDFILAYYRSFHWPVFNVADMSICAGAFLLVCDLFLEGRNQESGVRNQESEAKT